MVMLKMTPASMKLAHNSLPDLTNRAPVCFRMTSSNRKMVSSAWLSKSAAMFAVAHPDAERLLEPRSCIGRRDLEADAQASYRAL